MSLDVNSGFGSLALEIIERILHEEAPKAPVYLYSINNEVKVNKDIEKDDMAFETRAELHGINQALLFSELEDLSMVVPFDKIKVGKKIAHFYGSFDNRFA